MFYFIVFSLLFFEGRVIDYYVYVAKIEELWIKSNKYIFLKERKDVFTYQYKAEELLGILKCPSNSKLIIRLLSVLAVIIIMIRLFLFL